MGEGWNWSGLEGGHISLQMETYLRSRRSLFTKEVELLEVLWGLEVIGSEENWPFLFFFRVMEESSVTCKYRSLPLANASPRGSNI